MPDTDLEIRGGVVIQSGGGQSPKKIFLALRASVWSKNKSEGRQVPLDPSPGMPGSATATSDNQISMIFPGTN